MKIKLIYFQLIKIKSLIFFNCSEKFEFNIKDIIKQKDNILISNIEKRLKELNIIKEESEKESKNNNLSKVVKSYKEVSLYEICSQTKEANLKDEIKLNNTGKKNKFDITMIQKQEQVNNILGKLDINAKEFVPKNKKVVLIILFRFTNMRIIKILIILIIE